MTHNLDYNHVGLKFWNTSGGTNQKIIQVNLIGAKTDNNIKWKKIKRNFDFFI